MNIHLTLLQDRLNELRFTEAKLVRADDEKAAIAHAQISDTLDSIEAVLSDTNPLTVENAEAYCQRIVSDAVIIRSECKLDCDQPIIDVWFDLRGERTVMTVWVETNNRLYGEY